MPNTFADTILKRFLRYAVIDTMSDDKKVGGRSTPPPLMANGTCSGCLNKNCASWGGLRTSKLMRMELS